jgi:predicted dehydrogenase
VTVRWPDRSDLPRVGVVGSGTIATQRVSAWRRLGVGKITVLGCDGDGPAAAGIGGPHELLAELGSFLDRVDLVDICTRSARAASVMTAAASARRPTLCGWGFVSSIAEAEAISDVFDDNDVPLLAAGLRGVPPFAAAQQAIANGTIGQPAVLRLSVRSRPPVIEPSRPASIFLESMVAALDYVRWTGGEIETVHATVTGSGPVFALAILEHRGGAISHLEALWADRLAGPRTELEISGTDGIIAFRSDRAEPVTWTASGTEGQSGELVTGPPVDGLLEGALNMLKGREKPASTPRDWAAAFGLAHAALESSTRRVAVHMDQESR